MKVIHPKVAGATALTGAAGIVMAILSASGVAISPELAAAVGPLAAFIGGYMTPGMVGDILKVEKAADNIAVAVADHTHPMGIAEPPASV